MNNVILNINKLFDLIKSIFKPSKSQIDEPISEITPINSYRNFLINHDLSDYGLPITGVTNDEYYYSGYTGNDSWILPSNENNYKPKFKFGK